MKTEELMKQLIEAIETGTYKYTQMIPSERELVSMYGINRSSVKKAIQHLVNQDYLLKIHGKGTFVKKNIHEHLQIKFHGLSELLEREAITPSNLILASEIKKAGHIVGQSLQLAPHEDVFHLVRLRSGDGVPISIEDTYIPLAIIPDLQTYDFQIFSFYSILAAHNYQIDKIFQTIASSKVRNKEARLLKTSLMRPVVSLTIRAFTTEEKAVEYTEVTVLPEYAAIYTKNFHRGKETKIYAQID
ncbi:GntR family transcriptional regulator [Enterococcus faecalis]